MNQNEMRSGTLPIRLIGDIIFFKGNWFILGDKGGKYGLYVSRDLLSWEMIAARFNNYARMKEAGGRLFCFRHPFCGERSAFCDMMCSENGFDWEPVVFNPENGAPHYVLDILFEENHWIFLGESLKQNDSFKYGCFFSTPDLKNWKIFNTSMGFPEYNSLTLAYGNKTLASTARNTANEYVLLHSTDLRSWRKIQIPDGFYENLYFFQKTFFAFSLSLSSCRLSSDAVSWRAYEATGMGMAGPVKAAWPRTVQGNTVIRASLSGTDIYFSHNFLDWHGKRLPFKMHACAVNGSRLVLVSGKGEFLEADISFLA